MTEELYQYFEVKVGRIEVFFIFLIFFFQKFCVDLELKQAKAISIKIAPRIQQ